MLGVCLSRVPQGGAAQPEARTQRSFVESLGLQLLEHALRARSPRPQLAGDAQRLLAREHQLPHGEMYTTTEWRRPLVDSCAFASFHPGSVGSASTAMVRITRPT